MGEPALRVIGGQRPDPQRTLWRGLRQLWTTTHVQRISPDSRQKLRRSVALYYSFVRAARAGDFRCTGTISTGAAEITDTNLVEFFAFLRENGYAATTCNVTWRWLRKIFNLLGSPACGGHPAGIGWLDRRPHWVELPEDLPLVRVLTAAEIAALYLACRNTTWPRVKSIPPATVFRALFVGALTTGLRPNDLRYLARARVCLSPRCPLPKTKATNESGWIILEPSKTRKQRREVALPIHPCFRLHLDALLSIPGENVFPLNKSNHALGEQMATINREAVIVDEDGRHSIDPVCMYDFRKTCNNWAEDYAEEMGEWLLGHKQQGTNKTYYRDVLPKLIETVNSFTLPEICWTVEKPFHRQLRFSDDW